MMPAGRPGSLPHAEETEVLRFGDDDPYLAEDAVFVEALRSGNRGDTRSPYEDAFGTHGLTWAITDAVGGR